MTTTASNSNLTPPPDADQRRAAKPVLVYELDNLPTVDFAAYQSARETLEMVQSVVVPPRDARAFRVAAGQFFRIRCTEGPQVGDLNLWNANDLSESFYSGKTRALHRTHLSTGDRLWSTMPRLRPMATITYDSLNWYGFDADGAGVHDAIGTRCDPYTNQVLRGVDYHYCCHSNLTRALADETGQSLESCESHVHDVLNVFMCTGYTLDEHRYFMKASPVRAGDYLELIAEIDLIGALSTCPGGDCGASHSDDETPCFPLQVDILQPDASTLGAWQAAQPSQYSGSHGR